jgi:hypothetical protein
VFRSSRWRSRHSAISTTAKALHDVDRLPELTPVDVPTLLLSSVPPAKFESSVSTIAISTGDGLMIPFCENGIIFCVDMKNCDGIVFCLPDVSNASRIQPQASADYNLVDMFFDTINCTSVWGLWIFGVAAQTFVWANGIARSLAGGCGKAGGARPASAAVHRTDLIESQPAGQVRPKKRSRSPGEKSQNFSRSGTSMCERRCQADLAGDSPWATRFLPCFMRCHR